MRIEKEREREYQAESSAGFQETGNVLGVTPKNVGITRTQSTRKQRGRREGRVRQPSLKNWRQVSANVSITSVISETIHMLLAKWMWTV